MTALSEDRQLLFLQASKFQEQLIVLKMKITTRPKNQTRHIMLLTGQTQRTPA